MSRSRPRRVLRNATRSAFVAVATASMVVWGSMFPARSDGATLPPQESPHVSGAAFPEAPEKVPTSTGYGGAVSSVDPYATRIGLRVLRRGGNAVDAAVATAAALGVTEPYSAGIGGGGYLVVYDAETGRVRTIDGRETAPAKMPRDAFIDPATGEPYPFTPELVTSGVSVGVPGTPATWERALQKWGTWSLRKALRPATRLAQRGFVVDETFRSQTLDNKERFAAFRSTRKLFLPDGDAPAVGSRFRNKDLARTYRLLTREGMDAFYTGPLARQIARTVQDPPTTRSTDLPVPPGFMEPRDLARYEALVQRPTRVRYGDLRVFGMAPSSSGGSTVGEALNIFEATNPADRRDDLGVLHHYLEATALAFADRGAYLGDARFVDVPLADLLSQRFAKERACLIDEDEALPKPVAAGDVGDYDGICAGDDTRGRAAADTENVETTHLTTADRWGNVVAYTLTIEQTGGSGIVVPRRGFLLNNELTDFSLVFDKDDPNRIQPGKRPRSSMSPTILLRDGEPFLALGSPGGSTIITTVTQVVLNRLERGMTLPEAVAAPRASQRNTAAVVAEPEFIAAYGEALERLGHQLVPSGDAFTSRAEIGAATAIEFADDGRMTAVAEPKRRGGGSALVVSRTP